MRTRSPRQDGHDTQPTLDAGGGLRGHGHAHARHRGGQHRAVGDRRRPRHRSVGAAVGRRCVHHLARCDGHHGRLVGGPLRPAPLLRHRPRHLHRHLAAVRDGTVDHDAQRLARRARRWRGGHVRRLACRALQCVPPHGSAGQGARRIRGDDGWLVRHRPPRGRCTHVGPRLALDLPDQPPTRTAVSVDRPAVRRRVEEPASASCRPARPRHTHRWPVLARVRAAPRQRGWVGEPVDRRLVRRGGRAPDGVHRRRGASGTADVAAAVLPQPVVHRCTGGRLRHLGLAVRDVALHDAVPAADPRALGDRGGTRLPAREPSSTSSSPARWRRSVSESRHAC